jgi:hypothetical protein
MSAEVAASKRGKSVRFNPGFICSADPNTKPPLARLVVGGQGGEVRLKLFLTLAMRATATPYTLQGRTNDDLARLLRLPLPNGPRRVSAALKWLEANGYIKREARTGEAAALELLDGLGGPWTQEDDDGVYTSVPLSIWSGWWIHKLSPRALGIYLCLADLTSGGKQSASMSGYRKRQYGFSPDTWTRALVELQDADLIQIASKVEKGAARIKRRRNVYALTPDSKIHPAPSA